MSKSAKQEIKSAQDFCPKTQALIARRGYKVEHKLGQGAYGIVFKAVHQQTNLLSAVKIIDLKKMSERTRTKFLPRELETLIQCQHENLIQVYDIFRADCRMFIFMEFAGNGDIRGYSKKNNGIREEVACKWFMQASCGLAYLHETLFTTHRDIKMDNMLLDVNWTAKLTDFGFSKRSFDEQKKQLILSNTFCGTAPYECPQILEHKTYNAFKADIWSMGVTLFIMLHRKFPFDHKDRKKMLKQIHKFPRHLRSKFNDDLHDGAKALMEAMMNPDEEQRASVRTILQNNWLRSRVAN